MCGESVARLSPPVGSEHFDAAFLEQRSQFTQKLVGLFKGEIQADRGGVLERTFQFRTDASGPRKFRIRVRFQGAGCDTFVVQDVAVVNNAGTALEQVFTLTQPQYNPRDSLVGLKTKAEGSASCI